MRLLVLLLCASLLTGFFGRKRNQPAAGAPPLAGGPATTNPPRTTSNVVVTPGHSTAGRIASVNSAGRFVVLTFPLGTMPTLEKRLNVYRSGLKVAEVKVTGPQLDINIDADILAGECQVGDEVREE